MRKPVTIICLAFILLMPNIPRQVLANPASLGSANSGSFFCLSSNISVPQAKVNISLVCRDVVPTPSSGPIFLYEVEMNSSFQIRSKFDENTTIAFAYPASWRNWTRIMELNHIDFEVLIDDIEVPTQILCISELDLDYSELIGEDLESWGFLYENEFVLFNVSLEGCVTSIVEVNANFDIRSDADIFEFEYCVGTARTWNGNVVEEVQIQLHNMSLYEQNTLNPNNSLTVTQASDTVTGFWNLNFDSFQEDYVGVSIRQKTWPYGQYPSLPDSSSTTTYSILQDSAPIVVAFGVSVLFVTIAMIVASRRIEINSIQ